VILNDEAAGLHRSRPDEKMNFFDLRATALAAALVYSSSALAYIDPATGMLLLQSLIAAIAAGLVFVRKPFVWLAQKLKSLRKRDA